MSQKEKDVCVSALGAWLYRSSYDVRVFFNPSFQTDRAYSVTWLGARRCDVQEGDRSHNGVQQ